MIISSPGHEHLEKKGVKEETTSLPEINRCALPTLTTPSPHEVSVSFCLLFLAAPLRGLNTNRTTPQHKEKALKEEPITGLGEVWTEAPRVPPLFGESYLEVIVHKVNLQGKSRC